MAVTVDATGTAQDNGTTNVTSLSYTNITVGSGSNRALILMVGTSGGASAATSMTATWDNGGTNQAMTLLKNVSVPSSSNGVIWLFGLRNPTAGNKTLSISWTNSNNVGACAISFNGVSQVSDAAAFPNSNSATGTASPASITITSAVGNIPVSATNSFSMTSPNQTQIFLDGNTTNDEGGQRATGASTVTFTWTTGGGNANWGSVGCDVAAASTFTFFGLDESDASTMVVSSAKEVMVRY